jgi:hypothetical protein
MAGRRATGFGGLEGSETLKDFILTSVGKSTFASG